MGIGRCPRGRRQAPELLIVSCGALTLADPNERLNTVPLPVLPPAYAVPYRVLPDKINPASGLAPSLLGPEERAVKLYRFVKPVPLVLTANTVPRPPVPPKNVVPYRVLPDKINPACGLDPSLLV